VISGLYVDICAPVNGTRSSNEVQVKEGFLKAIQFARICFLLAPTLALGQANDVPLRSQPIPDLARTRKQQTPQDATLSFATAVTYDTGGFIAGAVAAADVNGDGKPDLVVVNACGSVSNCTSTNGSVGVLLNNGNGTFGTAVAYSSNGWSPNAVAVADVNGDGKPDIVVVNQCATNFASCVSTDGTVAVLLGNGDGTFQTAATYDSGGITTGGITTMSLAIADVNADGHPDLVVVNRCGSSNNFCTGHATVSVLLGNGDGTFQPAVTNDTGGFYANAVAVADLRGDGKLDLVVANACGPVGCPLGLTPQPGSVGVLLGNGDGTFQAATAYPTSAALTLFVAVADLNGDGILDIAASDDCATSDQQFCDSSVVGIGHIDLFVGNGDGTFSLVSTSDTSARDTFGVAIADMNGDGIPDLEVVVQCAPYSTTCSSSSSASVLLGNGDNTFQSAQYFGPIGSLAGAASLAALAVADVDGDGKPDLVLTDTCPADPNCLTDGAVGVMINTSSSADSAPSTTTVISSPNPSNIGQSVTFTVTVAASGSSSTPAGTVSLFNGSTSLGLFSLNSSGVATAAFTTLPAGTNSITATYNGDANLTASTSSALSQVVLGQDFSLTPASSTAAVMPGQTATYSVAVSPIGGFNQTVSLSCSGAPAQSVCSVSPISVTLDGSTTASVTVTVTTQGNSAALAPPTAFPRNGGGLLFGMALFGSLGLLVFQSFTPPGSERRSRPAYLLGVCVLSLGLSSLLGCGGSSSNSKGTPPAAYTLSLTGTDGSGSTALTHTTQLTLVVQ
jgi:Bacterial Ig-like domain (group 3)/FG-GAP-like repeat